jgi:predicted secreted protein
MTPGPRKFAHIMHITFSVGWLGAVVPYLALAIAGLTSHDAQMVRAAYLSIEWIGWFVIVPFSLAALLSGLIQSLGTQWGLFRHWWVLVKFLLTTGATIVLLRHMQAVTHMSGLAAKTILSAPDFRALRIQLVVHAGGGLLVLLAATVLSVYKPWGMTPYGRRKVSLLDRPSHPESDVRPGLGSVTRTSRWVYVVGVHAVGLALLFVVMHLTGGGLRSH